MQLNNLDISEVDVVLKSESMNIHLCDFKVKAKYGCLFNFVNLILDISGTVWTNYVILIG